MEKEEAYNKLKEAFMQLLDVHKENAIDPDWTEEYYLELAGLKL